MIYNSVAFFIFLLLEPRGLKSSYDVDDDLGLEYTNPVSTLVQGKYPDRLENGEPDTRSSQLAPELHPTFLMKRVHIDECLELSTTNCRLQPFSRNCSNGIGFFTTCTNEASNAEVQLFLSKIGNLNASRAVKVTVQGKREFKQETFQPVSDDLIILNVMNYDNLELSTLKHLKLPWLTHLGVTNSSNVVVDKDAFQPFPRLTMIVFERSTINFIHPKALDGMPYLRQLTLDAGLLNRAIAVREDVKKHLRLLHCDCHYQWLRDLLRNRPYLLKARKDGEVHNWGGFLSPQIRRVDNGAPVNCRTTTLISSNPEAQTEFSVDVDC